jgi:hypothetical protein
LRTRGPQTLSGEGEEIHTAGEAMMSVWSGVRAVVLVVVAVGVLLGCVCGEAVAAGGVFGVERFSNVLVDEAEAPVMGAGAHPYAMTTTIVFNHRVLEEEVRQPGEEPLPTKVETYGDPRNVETSLPGGVIADPSATPVRCSEMQLESGLCPAESAVGVLAVYVAGFPFRAVTAIYNMVPPTGVPGQFGANVGGLGYVIHINGKLRSEGDYSISASVTNILKTYPIYSISATLWGDPSAASHNAERGTCGSTNRVEKAEERSQWEAENRAKGYAAGSYQFECPVQQTETALLTMPSSCSAQALVSTVAIESWQGERVTADTASPPVEGCGDLQFEPAIEVEPESRATQTPTGLKVDLELPQNDTLSGLGEANLRSAVVTLPPGMSLNPSAAGGREGCGPAQIGPPASPDARQAIILERPTANTFTVKLDGSETAPLEAGASAATVREALEGLPGIGAGNVEVSAMTGGWEVQFTGALAGRQAPQLSGTVTDNAVQQLAVDATGGSFELSFGGENTTSLAYDAPAETVQKALEALPKIGTGDVAVTGGREIDIYTSARTPYTITFTGSKFAGKPVETLTVISALTGGSASVTSQAPGSQPLAVGTTQPGGATSFSPSAPECPNPSLIGTVKVTTPLLDHPLPGSVYLADQEANPFHSLFAIYLVVNDPISGVIVKLAGHVELGAEGLNNGLQPGQIRTTFEENPQLPFEKLELDLVGGPRAPLVTPTNCGLYTTTSELAPWSSPEGENAEPSWPFRIGPPLATGPECATPGFSPAFTAGTTNNQAGAYSPFVLSLSRDSQEQDLKGLETTLPPGLLAKLAGIPLCSSTQAETGTCPEASLIGTVTAAAGVGPDPVYVQGKIYLTSAYNEGPFGEATVVPAVAGPYNLGTVIVRGSIRINPHTAQATVLSDPFPEYIKSTGVRADVQHVYVDLDRSEFTLNPTSCSPMSLAATITSTTGTNANVSSPFEAANCSNLPFKPTFAVATQAKASKANGASLTIKITATTGQANTAKVKLTFPKQLPSRLTTLQKACLDATFETNPASCPEGSMIGTATVKTPLLASTLTGPIYLVSHGGAEFPDAEIVLQGEGITLILDGNTNIRHGITTSTFNTVPDAPFTSFESTLPQGPHSIFGTNIPTKDNYNLCGQKLTLPITFTAQNGAILNQTPKITINGCPKTKTKTSKHTNKAAKKTKKKK